MGIFKMILVEELAMQAENCEINMKSVYLAKMDFIVRKL